MIDSYGATTWRFRHFSPVAATASAFVHATVVFALLPEPLPQSPRVPEQAIAVTVELPAGPAESAPGEVRQHPVAVSATELESRLAQIVPSDEPPPPAAQDFVTGANVSLPAAELEKMLPPVAAPPSVSGQDFAATERPAASTAPSPPSRGQGTATPQRPVAQERSKEASSQRATEASRSAARQDYLVQIIRKVSRYRFYEESAETSEQGVVITRLTVARDGRLLDVTLAASSGHPNLDRGVMETIRRAAPFAPLPAEMAVDRYTFTLPLGYMRER